MEGFKGSSSEPLLQDSASSGLIPLSYSSSDLMKSDFTDLINHFSEYRPSYISTPFKGTCLQITKDKKRFVFGSREGRIAVCDIERKQLTHDRNLEEGSIWTIDITSDDQFVFSGGIGGKIKKFSLSTLAQEYELEGHSDEVNAVMLSKDDRLLYSASDDHTVRKWFLESRVGEALYSHHDKVYGLDLSVDNNHIASCAANGTVIVYNNIENREVFKVTVEESTMWCIKISAKNSYLIAGDNKALIYVWSFGDWVLKRRLAGHNDRVRCLEIASNERFFVSGGIDNMIKVWDLEKWRDEVTIYGHTDWVKGIIISNDLSMIHTMSDDCRIMTSKVPNFDDHINIKTESPLYKFIYNLKDKTVYATSINAIYKCTNNRQFDLMHSFAGEILASSLTAYGTIIAVFLKQEKTTETSVDFVNLYGQKEKKNLLLKTSSVISSAVATSDGSYLITGEAFRVTVWGMEGEIKHIFRSHTSDVTALVVDGLHLFAGDNNGIVKYYYLSDFQEIAQFSEENQTAIRHIKLSSNLKTFLSATGSSIIHIWSIETKGIAQEIHLSEPVKELHITADSKHFFFASGKTLQIWNMENFSKCSEITAQHEILSFSFTQDESELVLSFHSHAKNIPNPLQTKKFSVFGDHTKAHNFMEYASKIISGEVPKYDRSMDQWLIEPYHINTLHLFAYFNLNKHLAKSLKAGGSFFPSRAGYTALSISIDKKLQECIDVIFEAARVSAEKNPLAFYYFSSSIPALNRSSYPKLHQLYEMAFRKSFSANLPKFCDDSVDLPIVKQSPELFLLKEQFMEREKYHSEVVAIEFVQSYIKLNTTIGSNQSLEFMKSLIECKNLEVYSTSLVKTILEQKWKVIRWIFVCETLMYLTYLVMVCAYALQDRNLNEKFLILPFTINVILFLNEVLQMVSSKFLYFKSFWNYIDMFRFLLFSLFFILEVGYKDLERQQKLFLLLSVILSLIRGLSYFRIHSTTRWVVNLVFDVFYQLWALIIVAAYSIVALVVIYLALITENFFKENYQASDLENLKLQWIIFFFVLIVNPIIMLNLFISIIGDAFERSQDEKAVKNGQDLAEMIFEGELLFVWNRNENREKFVHVVREEHVEIQAQNTAGQRIKKISENVGALNDVAAKNRHEINDLKEIVTRRIVEIQSKTDEILKMVKSR